MLFRIEGLRNTWSDKCLKCPVSEDPSTSDMVNGPKPWLNMKGSTFTIFISYCERNGAGKRLS